MTEEVVCATCGRTHPIGEGELAFGLPDAVFALGEEERKERCKISNEIVALDGQVFFLRGLLPLKVAGRERRYRLGLWAEVSRGVLERVRELWSDPEQDREPVMPGKLANKVPFHSNTVGLTLGIQLTGPDTRPEFLLEPMEHSLYFEQLGGIEEHRAIEYSDPVARKAAIEQAVAADRGERRCSR